MGGHREIRKGRERRHPVKEGGREGGEREREREGRRACEAAHKATQYPGTVYGCHGK